MSSPSRPWSTGHSPEAPAPFTSGRRTPGPRPDSSVADLSRHDPAGGSLPGGFTLIELLIATMVLSVALSIAALVLTDLHEWSESSRSRLTRPDATLALLHLRRDLRSSRAFPSGAPNAPLVLLGAADQGLGRVVYTRRNTALERSSFDRSGELTGRTLVLAGVSSFRSTRAGEGLVEIEIGLSSSRGAGRPETVRLRVTLRNRPRSQW